MLSAAPVRPLANSHATADAQFIASMIAALDGDDSGTAANDAPLKQTAFRVYRNTVRLGALTRCGLTTRRSVQLVGDEWFAAAHRFLDEQPQPARVCWTMALASMLFSPRWRPLPTCLSAGHRHAGSRLDRGTLRGRRVVPHRCQHAGLAGSGERIYPHPATRAFWFADTPAAQLWCASRSGADDLSAIEWQGAGALLTRPHGAVLWSACDEATVALVAAFATDVGIADAIEQTPAGLAPRLRGAHFINC